MTWRNWMIAIIVVAGGVAYHNSLTGAFLFDDFNAIVDNPHIRRLWPLTEALTAPPQSTVDGRPVVALTLAVNYALGGLQVTGYHLFNVAVHLANALLLFGIVRRTRSCGPWLAVGVATLWVVHPLTTEAVNYIIQRTELLMAFFLLLTLYCFIRGWYVGSVAACAVGMGCKEVMAVAPVLVWLYDRTFLSGTIRQRPYYFAGLAATWLVLVAWGSSGPRAESLGFFTGDIGPMEYAVTQAGVILHYLRLAVWPTPLVVDYDDWPVGVNLPALLLIVALLAVTGWGSWRRTWWGFVGAWFFFILAPSSSVVPIATEIVAERRMYLPLAAVVMLAVIGGGAAWHLVQPSRLRLKNALTMILGGALVLGLMVFTMRRNEDYRTEARIWRDVLAKRPLNVRAHVNLGAVLVNQGEVAAGIAHHREALRLNPRSAEAAYNLGVALAGQGQTMEAIEYLRRATELSPRSAVAHLNLGRALVQRGDLAAAAHPLERAVELQPGSVEARCDYGSVLARLGRRVEAAAQFRAAVKLNPAHEKARRLLAITQEQGTQ